MKHSSTERSRIRPEPARKHPLLAVMVLAVLVLAVAGATRSYKTSASSLLQGSTLAIHDIQGSGSVSPFVGQVVSTTGVVTASKSNGFFLQTPDPQIDNDPNTSEGIFIFTSSVPASSVTVGSSMRVTGIVVEFRPSSDPASPPLTEIHPTAMEPLGPGTMPVPVTINPSDLSPSGSIEQLEKFEGMRVRVDSLSVVAPTGGTVNERDATSTSNGVFYGVLTGTARPLREPGVRVPDALPAGSPCCVPRFDANPELIRVDSNGQRGSSTLDVSTGAVIANLVGVLDYSSRSYTVLPDANALTLTPGIAAATPVSSPASDEFTVASFNMERFFDTINDPGVSDVALTDQAFNNRLNKASLTIRIVMRSPDIIGVEEVENLTTLQAIASRINGDTLFAGQPSPGYFPLLMEGNDPGGIDVGFLVKGSRVDLISVSQSGKDATFVNPNNGSVETLNDRPPLVLRANLTSPGGFGFPVTIIVNHLRSLSGIDDPTDGARVRAKRRAQAEFLANLIQARQTADSNERIVVVGDFNSFQFNDGYVDVIGTVKGTPTPANQVVLASGDLVNPDLVNITDLVASEQHYSFVFGGSAQTLDHILVSQNMFSRVARVEYAHSNADFPETFRNDPNRPERISDHDMPVAYFKLSPPASDLSMTKIGPDSVPASRQITYTIEAANNGTSTAADVSVLDPIGVDGTRFVSVSSTQGSCSPPSLGDRGAVVCRLGALGPGASARVTLVVTANLGASIPLTVTNTAIASALIGGVFNQTFATAKTTVTPAPTILSASITGKRLFVNGVNFQQGAVVEINGNAQKTANDDQMPTFVLIAKKGGKQIAPGENATLTALNPDGVRSVPFSFTRSVQ